MGARPPARDQKKAAACRGVVVFEDEASFWLDGTLHQTWSRKGVQPRVDTYGLRKTAHIFGANGPCHWLDEAGKAWLAESGDKIELYRLPPYSPEYNAMEGVWKTTKRVTTHNRFFRTTQERDDALRATFGTFRTRSALISGQVARYLTDDRLTT